MDVSQITPSSLFDFTKLADWYRKLVPAASQTTDEELVKNGVGQIIHSCFQAYDKFDYYQPLHEMRMAVLEHYFTFLHSSISEKAAESQSSSTSYAKEDQSEPLPVVVQLSIQMQITALSEYFKISPSLASSLISTLSSLLSSQCILSLHDEPSDPWAKLPSLLVHFIQNTSDETLKSQCVSCLFLISISTGSLSSILSFICGLLNVPSSLALPLSPDSLSNISVGTSLKSLINHPDVLSKATHWYPVVDKIVFSFPTPRSLLLNSSQETVSDTVLLNQNSRIFSSNGYVYVSDYKGVHQVGSGFQSTSQGRVYNSISWEKLGLNFVENVNENEFISQFKSTIAVGNGLLFVSIPLIQSIIVLSSNHLTLIDKFDWSRQYSSSILSVTSDSKSLYIIKQSTTQSSVSYSMMTVNIDIKLQSLSHFFSSSTFDWQTLPINDELFSSTLTPCLFSSLYYHTNSVFLSVFKPSDATFSSVSCHSMKLSDLVFTTTTVKPLPFAFDHTSNHWISIAFDLKDELNVVSVFECNLMVNNRVLKSQHPSCYFISKDGKISNESSENSGKISSNSNESNAIIDTKFSEIDFSTLISTPSIPPSTLGYTLLLQLSRLAWCYQYPSLEVHGVSIQLPTFSEFKSKNLPLLRSAFILDLSVSTIQLLVDLGNYLIDGEKLGNINSQLCSDLLVSVLVLLEVHVGHVVSNHLSPDIFSINDKRAQNNDITAHNLTPNDVIISLRNFLYKTMSETVDDTKYLAEHVLTLGLDLFYPLNQQTQLFLDLLSPFCSLGSDSRSSLLSRLSSIPFVSSLIIPFDDAEKVKAEGANGEEQAPNPSNPTPNSPTPNSPGNPTPNSPSNPNENETNNDFEKKLNSNSIKNTEDYGRISQLTKLLFEMSFGVNSTGSTLLETITADLATRVFKLTKNNKEISKKMAEKIAVFSVSLLEQSNIWAENFATKTCNDDAKIKALQLSVVYSVIPNINDIISRVYPYISNQSLYFDLSCRLFDLSRTLSSIQSQICPFSPSLSSLQLPKSPPKLSHVHCGTKIMESTSHPYNDNEDYELVCEFPSAEYLTLDFDPRTAMENRYDYLIISKQTGGADQVGKYTGRNKSDYPSSPITVYSNKLFFSFHSDGSNTDWGWLVTVNAFAKELPELPKLDWLSTVLIDLSNLIGKVMSMIVVDSVKNRDLLIKSWKSVLSTFFINGIDNKIIEYFENIGSEFSENDTISLLLKFSENETVKAEFLSEIFKICRKSEINVENLGSIISQIHPEFSEIFRQISGSIFYKGLIRLKHFSQSELYSIYSTAYVSSRHLIGKSLSRQKTIDFLNRLTNTLIHFIQQSKPSLEEQIEQENGENMNSNGISRVEKLTVSKILLKFLLLIVSTQPHSFEISVLSSVLSLVSNSQDISELFEIFKKCNNSVVNRIEVLNFYSNIWNSELSIILKSEILKYLPLSLYSCTNFINGNSELLLSHQKIGSKISATYTTGLEFSSSDLINQLSSSFWSLVKSLDLSKILDQILELKKEINEKSKILESNITEFSIIIPSLLSIFTLSFESDYDFNQLFDCGIVAFLTQNIDLILPHVSNISVQFFNFISLLVTSNCSLSSHPQFISTIIDSLIEKFISTSTTVVGQSKQSINFDCRIENFVSNFPSFSTTFDSDTLVSFSNLLSNICSECDSSIITSMLICNNFFINSILFLFSIGSPRVLKSLSKVLSLVIPFFTTKPLQKQLISLFFKFISYSFFSNSEIHCNSSTNLSENSFDPMVEPMMLWKTSISVYSKIILKSCLADSSWNQSFIEIFDEILACKSDIQHLISTLGSDGLARQYISNITLPPNKSIIQTNTSLSDITGITSLNEMNRNWAENENFMRVIEEKVEDVETKTTNFDLNIASFGSLYALFSLFSPFNLLTEDAEIEVISSKNGKETLHTGRVLKSSPLQATVSANLSTVQQRSTVDVDSVYALPEFASTLLIKNFGPNIVQIIDLVFNSLADLDLFLCPSSAYTSLLISRLRYILAEFLVSMTSISSHDPIISLFINTNGPTLIPTMLKFSKQEIFYGFDHSKVKGSIHYLRNLTLYYELLLSTCYQKSKQDIKDLMKPGLSQSSNGTYSFVTNNSTVKRAVSNTPANPPPNPPSEPVGDDEEFLGLEEMFAEDSEGPSSVPVVKTSSRRIVTKSLGVDDVTLFETRPFSEPATITPNALVYISAEKLCTSSMAKGMDLGSYIGQVWRVVELKENDTKVQVASIDYDCGVSIEQCLPFDTLVAVPYSSRISALLAGNFNYHDKTTPVLVSKIPIHLTLSYAVCTRQLISGFLLSLLKLPMDVPCFDPNAVVGLLRGSFDDKLSEVLGVGCVDDLTDTWSGAVPSTGLVCSMLPCLKEVVRSVFSSVEGV
ncbi:hypothetical protein RCL1_008604 [Eukaryota sp. TZLM3-RCL]